MKYYQYHDAASGTGDQIFSCKHICCLFHADKCLLKTTSVLECENNMTNESHN